MALSRRTLLASGLAAGAGLTSGCAGKPLDTLLTQAAQAPRTPATLTWWVSEIPSRNGPVVADLIIRAFERRHPQIRVRKSNALSTTDSNRAAVTTQLAGASPTPDVYLGDTTWPAQFGANSLALPLQKLLPKDFWTGYPAALRRVSEYRGAVYALPFFTDSAFLYYRKDLLAKHGRPVPRSWEELLRTARTIQRAGDAPYGFLWQGSVSESLTCNVAEFLADAEAPVLDGEGRVALNGPGAERAFAMMREFTETGVTPSTVATYVEADSQDAFTGGRGVFLRNWSYAWGNAADRAVSKVAGRVGVAPRPGFDGDGPRGVSCAGGWSNFVNPNSSHLGAAVAFARFCAGEEAQLILLKNAGVIPALEDVLTRPEARAVGDPTLTGVRELHLVARPVQTPYYPQVSKALYTRANAVIGGRATPAQALRAARADIRTALEGKAL
ncbi:ABC transporter substrate-binding protein [Streptomyces decoyicus]|uniref:ABC transporter substrate-binding protein n=1 Tax=Streptomyces decoyicus TaxID=249567 RepID=A0ABZ1FEE9_9ACTN|nr:ABC transporter substrate-binding protein [Streptomyces decoyicus]WSB68168.1 ABC transporter substrate-binding protein [Streptomyces decoyicus]